MCENLELFKISHCIIFYIQTVAINAAGGKALNVKERNSVSVNEMTSIESLAIVGQSTAYLLTSSNATVNDNVTIDAANINSEGSNYKQTERTRHRSMSRNSGGNFAGKAYSVAGIVATVVTEEYFEEDEEVILLSRTH